MYQEIHEVAGLERRPVSQSYEMLALAAFESLPTALLAPTDDLRPDAPLIADALRRLDVDYVAAGMEALEALHSAATAAVDAAAAAAAAPLLAALRRQVRAASAALERERAHHSSEADVELAAELEERALQRQSMSIRRVLRQPQADEAVGAAAVAESGLPRSSGETDPEYSDDNDVDATWASDQLSEASAESVAVESFIADCPPTLDQTTRVEIGLPDIVSGRASEHLLSLPDANDDRSAGDSPRTPGVHAGSGDAEPMHVSVGVSGASADGSKRRPGSSSMDNTEVKTLHAAGAGQPGISKQVLQEEQIPQIVASRAAALPPLLDQVCAAILPRCLILFVFQVLPKQGGMETSYSRDVRTCIAKEQPARADGAAGGADAGTAGPRRHRACPPARPVSGHAARHTCSASRLHASATAARSPHQSPHTAASPVPSRPRWRRGPPIDG